MKNEDDLKKNKMNTTSEINKNEDDLKKTTKKNLIGCDIIVN